MEEKIKEPIEEVLDEIDSALKDGRGLASHQRRLAFSLSLGGVYLIERYLKKKKVLRSGAKINHLWLKKKKENAKDFIYSQIIGDVKELKGFDKILDLAYQIEKDRNEIAYGKEVNEEVLRNKINIFPDMKKEVEKND